MYTYYLEKDSPAHRLQVDCLDYCIIDNRIWMLGKQTQAVFSLDAFLEDLILEYVMEEKGEIGKAKEVYHFLRKKDDKLYLFPALGNSIKIVELETKKIERKNIFTDPSKICVLENVIEYEDVYYLFPSYGNAPLVCFDGIKIGERAGWIEYMQKLAGTDNEFVTQSLVYEDGKVWIVLEGTNKLTCTMLDTMQIECYQIPVEGYFIDVAGKRGDKFWMAPSGKGKIICWSIEKGIEKEYDEFPEGFEFSDEYSFSKIICLEDSVWFLPRCVQDILVLDLNLDKFVLLHLPKDLWRPEVGAGLPHLYAYMLNGNQLILPACGCKYHMIIDLSKREIIKKADAELPKEYYQRWLEEKNTWIMQEFIKNVQEHNPLSEYEKKCLGDIDNPGTCGKKIWKQICGITKRSDVS